MLNRYLLTERNFHVIVEKEIHNILDEFQQKPEIYLTESDIKCRLYFKLIRYKCMKQTRTSEGALSIPVHTEVRWYGNSRALKYLSDIVVLDITTLKTEENGRFKLLSKGYAFNKAYAVIEIKLRRRTSKSNNAFKKEIIKDIDKQERLKSELNNDNTDYYVMALDKKILNPEILNTLDSYAEQKGVKLHYMHC